MIIYERYHVFLNSSLVILIFIITFFNKSLKQLQNISHNYDDDEEEEEEEEEEEGPLPI